MPQRKQKSKQPEPIVSPYSREHKYKDKVFTIRPNVLNTSDAVLDLADQLNELEWAEMLPVEATDIYAEYRGKLSEVEQLVADSINTAKSAESSSSAQFKKEYKERIETNKKAIERIEKELRIGRYGSLIALIANKQANVRLKFQNNPDNMKRLFAAMIEGDIPAVVYDVSDPDYLALRRWVCDYFFIIRSAIHRPIMIV